MEVRETLVFAAWLPGLADRRAARRIQVRIDRLALGNAGDVRPVGAGVSEMRIHYGPGYRVYFSQRGQTLVILLWVGDKSSHTVDHSDGSWRPESSAERGKETDRAALVARRREVDEAAAGGRPGRRIKTDD